MRYGWVDGARTGRMKVEDVVPTLLKLEQKRGALTASAVLKEAKKKTSPLHPWFEWDDTAAAHQYRLARARKLIHSIRVTVEAGDEEEITVRAFIQGGAGPEYESTMEIMRDPEKAPLVLQRAMEELAAFRKKYGSLSALAEVFAAMDAVEIAA